MLGLTLPIQVDVLIKLSTAYYRVCLGPGIWEKKQRHKHPLVLTVHKNCLNFNGYYASESRCKDRLVQNSLGMVNINKQLCKNTVS